MLREAAALDPANFWDAQRMLTALTAESNEEYVQYLNVQVRRGGSTIWRSRLPSAQDPTRARGRRRLDPPSLPALACRLGIARAH